MNLEEYGDKLINENLKELVESNPYFAFIVMSSAIEFIARCKYQLRNINDNSGQTSKRYIDTINNLNAFAAYRQFNDGHKNKLYTALRCGLLHSTLPDKKIVLSSGRNDLANNVVGCISLYEDVKNAWAEIKSNASILQYLQTQKGLKISDTLPSQTEN